MEPDLHPALAEQRQTTELSERERAVLDAWREGLLVPRGDGPRRSGPGLLSATGALLGLVLIVALLSVLLLLVGLLNATSGAAGDMGRTAGDAAGQVGRAAGGAVQSAADLLDPAHPPRETLDYDTELASLEVFEARERLGETTNMVLTLREVKRRPQASGPRLGLYAVIQQAYRTPREQRVLGLVVGTDTGEAEHYVYAGESFRVGRTLYKVNWISFDEQQIALATHRQVDTFGGALKFEVE